MPSTAVRRVRSARRTAPLTASAGPVGPITDGQRGALLRLANLIRLRADVAALVASDVNKTHGGACTALSGRREAAISARRASDVVARRVRESTHWQVARGDFQLPRLSSNALSVAKQRFVDRLRRDTLLRRSSVYDVSASRVETSND